MVEVNDLTGFSNSGHEENVDETLIRGESEQETYAADYNRQLYAKGILPLLKLCFVTTFKRIYISVTLEHHFLLHFIINNQ